MTGAGAGVAAMVVVFCSGMASVRWMVMGAGVVMAAGAGGAAVMVGVLGRRMSAMPKMTPMVRMVCLRFIR